MVSSLFGPNHAGQKNNMKPGLHQPICFLPLSQEHRHLKETKCLKILFRFYSISAQNPDLKRITLILNNLIIITLPIIMLIIFHEMVL